MIISNRHSGYFLGIRLYHKGGGSTTINESIPAWAVPYMKNVGDRAESLYGSGQLDNVAGASNLQQRAFGGAANAISTSAGQGMDELRSQQGRLRNIATSGGYDTTAIKDKAVLEAGMNTAKLGQQYGASGTLGSGRQAVMQGAQNAATAAAFAGADRDANQQMIQNRFTAEQGLGNSVSGSQQIATGAASSLANLGNQQRGIDQQQQDAPWQALQRYASTIYGNPARQNATTSGGK